MKNYKVDLHLNEAFQREAMNPYERLVDLLKVLQEGKTRQELMDYYSISRKPLGEDIDKLINETMILGQRVKIRDIQSEKRKITYQSTVHPVFLPLNMTEVYYLIMGLKSLSKDSDSIASKSYDHLANRVYCQLSDYARNKIDKKGNEMGMEFPKEDDFNLYNGSRDEEKMSNEDIESKLMYLYKAGVMCNIQLNDNTSYVDYYIDYDINENKIYLKHTLHGERIRKLYFEQICNLQYVYE